MKRLFLCSLFFTLPSCAGYVDRLKNFCLGRSYQAVNAYAKQDYNTALADLEILLNKNPYDSELNYNIGTILYKQQKYADAQQSFLRVVEDEKTSADLQMQANFNLGNCYYQEKEWQKATDIYRKVLKNNPDNQRAQHNLQLALYKLQEQQMQDRSQQQQENQKNDQTSQDQQNQSQSSKSCDGSQQDRSEKNQSGQQQGDQKQEQQGGSKQDGKSGTGQQQDKRNGDQGDDEQDEQDSNSGDDEQAQSGGKQQQGKTESQDGAMSEEEIVDKNKQALQDVADKVENAGKADQQKQTEGKDPKNEQNLSDQFDQTEGSVMPQESAQAEMPDNSTRVSDGKEMGGLYKKPELKNQLQKQYEDKASDDERLTDYHASVMKTLENLEEKIQKHVIKNKVAMQGAGQNGKKGW